MYLVGHGVSQQNIRFASYFECFYGRLILSFSLSYFSVAMTSLAFEYFIGLLIRHISRVKHAIDLNILIYNQRILAFILLSLSETYEIWDGVISGNIYYTDLWFFEAAVGGCSSKQMFLKILQYLQENTCFI